MKIFAFIFALSFSYISGAHALNAIPVSPEIAKKCMSVAYGYSQKHAGLPWSADARFGYINSHICTILVSDVGYDGQVCNPTYVIDLRSWSVTQIDFAGCIDQN
jgi:hypothetical protein